MKENDPHIYYISLMGVKGRDPHRFYDVFFECASYELDHEDGDPPRVEVYPMGWSMIIASTYDITAGLLRIMDLLDVRFSHFSYAGSAKELDSEKAVSSLKYQTRRVAQRRGFFSDLARRKGVAAIRKASRLHDCKSAGFHFVL